MCDQFIKLYEDCNEILQIKQYTMSTGRRNAMSDAIFSNNFAAMKENEEIVSRDETDSENTEYVDVDAEKNKLSDKSINLEDESSDESSEDESSEDESTEAESNEDESSEDESTNKLSHGNESIDEYPTKLIQQRRTGVNDVLIEKLIIASRDAPMPMENINANLRDYLESEEAAAKLVVYPPNEKTLEFYEDLMAHIRRNWSADEFDLKRDITKFKHAPKALQELTLPFIGMLLVGDVYVAELTSKTNKITCSTIQMFYDNQRDRENTHQLMYSKWCDVVENGDYYRSQAFIDDYLPEFKEICKKYEKYSEDIRVVLFMILLSESILFAAAFQVLCKLATTGYAQNLTLGNRLVMVDEFLHNAFTRKVLSKFKVPMNLDFANMMLNDFFDFSLKFATDIAKRANYEDLTADEIEAHCLYIKHKFKSDNCLYYTATEENYNEMMYGETPAEAYMDFRYATKSNLMESTPINYEVVGPKNKIEM